MYRERSHLVPTPKRDVEWGVDDITRHPPAPPEVIYAQEWRGACQSRQVPSPLLLSWRGVIGNRQ